MTDVELLPLPEPEPQVSVAGAHEAMLADALEDYFDTEAVQSYARAVAEHNVKERDAEIEALRAALESLKAHKENATMRQNGAIKALTEIRDEQGAEIHRLRAELEIEKGQADFYRTTRNWSQQKAERLAEAIGAYKAECDSPAKDYVLRAKRRDEMFALLRDHDQEGKDG